MTDKNKTGLNGQGSDQHTVKLILLLQRIDYKLDLLLGVFAYRGQNQSDVLADRGSYVVRTEEES